MSDSDEIKKYLEEYKTLKSKYQDFSKAVSGILEQILKSNNFKNQSVQCRSKDLDSLNKKLIKNPSILKDGIEDLSGCRVIFYLEEDIARFERCLMNEFVILKTKIKNDPDSYKAIHLIVKLNDSRSKLVEYSEFQNIVCEIQLTTSLFHAWSEVNHDIIYKQDSKLKEFSKKDFDFLDKKLKEVMSKYINKASYAFSFIAGQFGRIKEGEKILNIDTLNEKAQSNSNEEIYDYLNALIYAGNYYRLPDEFDFLTPLESIWTKSQENDQKEQIRSSEDIVTISFKFIKNIKYWDYENIIKTCVRKCKNNLFKKECLETLQEFAKYDLNVVKVIGYHPQKILIESIHQLDMEDCEIRKSVNSICNSLLNNNIECQSQEKENTLTLIMGPIPVNEVLIKIRKSAISLLIGMLDYRKCNDGKDIVNALFNSTIPSHHGKANQKNEEIIEDNLKEITLRLEEIYSILNNCTKRYIEKNLAFISRGEYASLEQIIKINKKISEDSDYIKYKTFVGFDLDYGLDYDKIGEERQKRIDEYIQQITESNLNEWIDFLVKEVLVDLENVGNYPNVHNFLRLLAIKNPEIGKRFLIIEALSKFKISLLIGLLESDKKEEIKKEINEQVSKGENLSEIASAYRFITTINESELREVAKKILEKKEQSAIINLLETICKHYPIHRTLKEIFIKSIEKLTELSVYNWSYRISYLSEPITSDLSVKEYEVILNNLIHVKDINYDIEKVLLPLANKNPIMIIDFFYKRIKIASDKQDIIDAIPFRFQLLNNPLAKNPKEVISEIIKWFDNKEWLDKWEASHIINIIFPIIEGDFKEEIIQLIRSKNEEKLDNVLWILDKYDGHEDVLEIVKEIVINFKQTNKLKNRLFVVLSQMGVVTGEYGISNNYENKIKAIDLWIKEQNKDISEFAKSYIEYLQNCIKYENERVEREKYFRENEFMRFKNLNNA